MSLPFHIYQASWNEQVAERVRVHALDVTPARIRAWLAEASECEETEDFKTMFKTHFLPLAMSIVDTEVELRETCKKLMSVARKAGVKLPSPQQYARVNQGHASFVAEDLRARLLPYQLDEHSTAKQIAKTRKKIELEREKSEVSANAGFIIEGKRRRNHMSSTDSFSLV